MQAERGDEIWDLPETEQDSWKSIIQPVLQAVPGFRWTSDIYSNITAYLRCRLPMVTITVLNLPEILILAWEDYLLLAAWDLTGSRDAKVPLPFKALVLPLLALAAANVYKRWERDLDIRRECTCILCSQIRAYTAEAPEDGETESREQEQYASQRKPTVSAESAAARSAMPLGSGPAWDTILYTQSCEHQLLARPITRLIKAALKRYAPAMLGAERKRVLWECLCGETFHCDFDEHREQAAYSYADNLCHYGLKSTIVSIRHTRWEVQCACRSDSVCHIVQALRCLMQAAVIIVDHFLIVLWSERLLQTARVPLSGEALQEARARYRPRTLVLHEPESIWVTTSRPAGVPGSSDHSRAGAYRGRPPTSSDGTQFGRGGAGRSSGDDAPAQADIANHELFDEDGSTADQTPMQRWLLLCLHNQSETYDPVHLRFANWTSDQELFEKIRNFYSGHRSVLRRWLWWKGVIRTTFSRFQVALDPYRQTQLALLNDETWTPPTGWTDGKNWEPIPGPEKPAYLLGIEAYMLYNMYHPDCQPMGKLRQRFGSWRSVTRSLFRGFCLLALHLFIALGRSLLPARFLRDGLPLIEHETEMQRLGPTAMQHGIRVARQPAAWHSECDLASSRIPKRCNIKLKARGGDAPFGWGIVMHEGFRPPIFAKAVWHGLLTTVLLACVVAAIYYVPSHGFESLNLATLAALLVAYMSMMSTLVAPRSS